MAGAERIQLQMVAAIDARDFDRLRSLYHPDYTYAGPDGVEHKGADAGIAAAEMYTTAFPDLRLEIRAQWAPDDSVAIMELVAAGTHTHPLGALAATGRRAELTVCNVIETLDGLVHREREYFDRLSLMAQLGASGE